MAISNIQSSQAVPKAAGQAAPGSLNISTEQLLEIVSLSRNINDSNRALNQVQTRPLPGPAAAAAAQVPEVKPEMLTIGAPAVDVANYKPAYQQMAGNLALLKYLVKDPQVSKLIDQAIQENNLLKGVNA
jgi:hypothetical protein